MNAQTKAAIERLERKVAERPRLLEITSTGDGHSLLEDVQQLLAALGTNGELYGYSEWLDGQGIIAGDVELTDDSGNATGEIDDRSHEQLVRDYLEEN